MKKYSLEIADAIRNFFDSGDWHYSFDDENGIYRFGLNIPGKMKTLQYVIDLKESDFIGDTF